MELDGAWVLFALVELFSEQLRQHFVYSQVGQKAIVVLKQLALVLELLKVALKLVVADDFSDAWDVQILDLVLECSCRVLDNDTDSRILVLRIKWMINSEHLRLG